MVNFKFQFIGSGNARSKPPVNYNTNVLVHAPGGKWLIDFGLMGPLALQNAGYRTAQIDAAFITHLHGDHVYGIEEVLFESFFKLHRRFTLWLPTNFVRPYAAPGEDIWENFLKASMTSAVLETDGYRQLSFEDYADIQPIEVGKKYSFMGVPVETFPVNHVWNRSAFGICLDDRIFYTSDSTFSRRAIERVFERGAELLFHDVSFLPARPGAVHASFDELKTLPKDMIEKIVLMHYADEVTDDEKQNAIDLGFRLAKCGQVFEF